MESIECWEAPAWKKVVLTALALIASIFGCLIFSAAIFRGVVRLATGTPLIGTPWNPIPMNGLSIEDLPLSANGTSSHLDPIWKGGRINGIASLFAVDESMNQHGFFMILEFELKGKSYIVKFMPNITVCDDSRHTLFELEKDNDDFNYSSGDGRFEVLDDQLGQEQEEILVRASIIQRSVQEKILKEVGVRKAVPSTVEDEGGLSQLQLENPSSNRARNAEIAETIYTLFRNKRDLVEARCSLAPVALYNIGDRMHYCTVEIDEVNHQIRVIDNHTRQPVFQLNNVGICYAYQKSSARAYVSALNGKISQNQEDFLNVAKQQRILGHL